MHIVLNINNIFYNIFCSELNQMMHIMFYRLILRISYQLSFKKFYLKIHVVNFLNENNNIYIVPALDTRLYDIIFNYLECYGMPLI